jgi:hypothetical protein
MISGERARILREEIAEATLDAVATFAKVNTGALSRFERGASCVLSTSAIQRVEQTLNKFIAVRKKFKGVSIDMGDIRFLRKQVRELGRKNPPVSIVQVWGPVFVSAFCALANITVIEFFAMAQLRPSLANAEIYSTPCQRWCAAWTTGIEREIKSSDDAATFDNYAERFESRQAALEHLARVVFDKLLAEVGKAKIQEYQSALLLTGELRAAPKDTTEN